MISHLQYDDQTARLLVSIYLRNPGRNPLMYVMCNA